MESLLRDFLSMWEVLAVWAALVVASLAWLVRDLKKCNSELGSFMKWVWGFTVLYSGPVGLGVYFYSGRKQISRDSLWRKACRSVAHCYSGCGAGEVTGIFIAVGLLALGNWWAAAITFTLAYLAGYAMTVGPLLQDGVPLKNALKDAFYSETASITVMEITAIGVDLWLAADATMGETLFWSSLVFSLTTGLLAAYPVNVLLIHWGVKEGMHNPKMMAEHGGHG